MLRLMRPKFIRRFSHTHSKTTFPENSNKVIEDLIRQQNERLTEIKKEIGFVSIVISLLSVPIAWNL